MPRHLYALDLDGTCLDDSGQSSPELRRKLERLAERAVLVFATGRNLQSACEAIESAELPRPHYLVTDVGNQVYCWNGRWELDPIYEAFNISRWAELRKSCSVVDLAPWAIPQQTIVVRRHALWADSKRAAIKAVQLLEKSIGSRVGRAWWDGPTRAKKWWIDLLPACAGKATAVSFIAVLEGIPHRSVAAVGDSLNDVDLLDGRFHAAAPANASLRLERALLERGVHLTKMPRGGPRGTADALVWLKPHLERDSTRQDHPWEPAQLLALRHKRSTACLANSLLVWPDRLRNWGLRPPPSRKATESLTEAVESHLAAGRNWWWEAANPGQRHRILERFRAIPVRFLADKLDSYVRCRWPAARLLGAMASGSYLYGDLPANDLDLVLLLEGMPPGSGVGVEENLPGLRAAFPARFAKQLRFDRVGFGILDQQSVNATNPDPIMLQIAASMEGSGLPLFGQITCDAPMPAFDLLSQAVKLIGDAAGHLARQGSEAENKIRLRCEETNRVLALAARTSFPGTKRAAPLPDATPACMNLESCLRRHRRKLAQDYFVLVNQRLRNHE